MAAVETSLRVCVFFGVGAKRQRKLGRKKLGKLGKLRKLRKIENIGRNCVSTTSRAGANLKLVGSDLCVVRRGGGWGLARRLLAGFQLEVDPSSSKKKFDPGGRTFFSRRKPLAGTLGLKKRGPQI